MIARLSVAVFAVALVACAPSKDDVEGALKWSESTNAATIADTTCGFPTFGLDSVKIDMLTINGGAGSATVSGTAKEGPRKGSRCTGAISFHYVRGRSVTQAANGSSVSFIAVITDVSRTGP